MELDPGILSSFQVSGIQAPHSAKITCLDFDASGERMITTSKDESMCLFDVSRLQEPQVIFSKKYGCASATFTHKNTTVVHASTKGDKNEIGVLRYLSLHDNKYLRYFRGHTRRIAQVCVAPLDDLIMTSAADSSVRFWDLRSSSCQFPGENAELPIAFDPTGMVFAIGFSRQKFVLYDARQYQKGPFGEILVDDPTITGHTWRSLSFSADGKVLLLNTSQKQYLIDTMIQSPMTLKKSFAPTDAAMFFSTPTSAYTSDGKYVYAGILSIY